MKKKDVNYRVIMGMHAVGNQCKDCDSHINGIDNDMCCIVLSQSVNPKATCDKFSDQLSHDDFLLVKADRYTDLDSSCGV